ncbi:MAG TPA: tol-pal system-associated acyl-CoA thioesterase [Acetobacteraceae bacterium]|nr:tol-pal system-associated acyl-CoA thioesterase [Acetobacteraceae bacterium]
MDEGRATRGEGTLRSGQHRYPLRVYYEDTDAGGIVYHANYLRFAERARTETLRALGVPHAEMVRDCHAMFVVRRVKLDYARPARLDDSLEVVTEPLEVRAAVVKLRQDIRGPLGSCAVAEIELACVVLAGTRPARIPSRWRAAFERMLADRPPAERK